MDALSSFDTALVCFLNEILLNNIEKHTTSIVLPRRHMRKNKRMLKFSELKDGRLLWTAFKWLINTSLRNVNLDVAFDDPSKSGLKSGLIFRRVGSTSLVTDPNQIEAVIRRERKR